MRTSLLAVQKYIFSSLANYQPLTDVVTGIFDYVPLLNEDKTNAIEAPYVAIGNPTVIDWGYEDGHEGEQATFTLHVWSEQQGKTEVYDIFNLMMEALTEPLSIEDDVNESIELEDGFILYLLKKEFMDVIYDPDDFRHGIIRFRFYVSL